MGGIKATWRRALGADTERDLLTFGAVFVVFFVLDQLLLRATTVNGDSLASSSLTVEALTGNPVFVFVVLAGLLATTKWAPRRITGPWSDLELGPVLRWFVVALLVVQTWRHVTLDVDFLTGRWHVPDRILLVALAVAAGFRPLALVGWCFVARALNETLLAPSNNTSSVNIDEFVVIAFVAIVAGLVLGALVDRPSGDTTLALLATMVATYFFAPGAVKMLLAWVQVNDTENLALASYTAGFRGSGDGSTAQSIFDFMQSTGLLVKLGAVVIEVGAVIAILHYRVFRIWLLGPAIFHLSVFAVTGYWLMNWALLELFLLVIFWLPSVQPVVRRNLTPARALLCAGIVAVPGFVIFHAPLLGWLDAPVSYGYVVEGVDEDGNRYSIDASAFAPYGGDVAFGRLVPVEPPVAVGAYGFTRDRALIDALRPVRTWAELEAVEARFDNPNDGRPEESEEFYTTFLEYWSQHPGRPGYLIQPPARFHTSSPPPSARPGDDGPPIVQLEVFRITSIHASPELGVRKDRVLMVQLDSDGNAVVIESEETG